MTKPILYDYWRSSASYRVRIALNLKEIAYEARSVDLLSGAQRSPEHLARNPQGLVPVLEVDGLRLTQSLAIIEYLEETRPAVPLVPGDAGGRARVRALAQAIAIEIHPVCNLSLATHVVELAGGGDETKAAWMQRYIGTGLANFEKLLDSPATGRFCHGDRPGLADCCLMPQLYNALRWDLDLSAWPRISRIADACAALSPVAAAHPDEVKKNTPSP